MNLEFVPNKLMLEHLPRYVAFFGDGTVFGFTLRNNTEKDIATYRQPESMRAGTDVRLSLVEQGKFRKPYDMLVEFLNNNLHLEVLVDENLAEDEDYDYDTIVPASLDNNNEVVIELYDDSSIPAPDADGRKYFEKLATVGNFLTGVIDNWEVGEHPKPTPNKDSNDWTGWKDD